MKTNFLFNFFPPENPSVCEIMLKGMLGPLRPLIRCMLIECYITKSTEYTHTHTHTHTLRICNTYCLS